MAAGMVADGRVVGGVRIVFSSPVQYTADRGATQAHLLRDARMGVASTGDGRERGPGGLTGAIRAAHG